MNSGGWFLLLILVVLILIAMCRKHCCLRNAQQRLSYNEILENIALQNPLFANYRNNQNNNDMAGGSSGADDNKPVGITPEELDAVSTIDVYPKKKRSRMSLNFKQQHRREINKYRGACCICLFDYRGGDKIRKLNCNHYFHKQCIDIWFKRNIQCPLCKQYVINAQILSKRSSRHSDASTSTTSSSSHTSTSKSSSSSSTTTTTTTSEDGEYKDNTDQKIQITTTVAVAVTADDWSIPCTNEEQKHKETEMHRMDAQHTYSLSDSHCVQSHQQSRASNKKTRIPSTRHRTRHSHSQSYSPSLSAGLTTRTHTHSSCDRPSAEITSNHHSSNPTTTTATTTAMTTTTTTIAGTRSSSSNDTSMSPSCTAGTTQQQQQNELGLLDDKNTFIPLTPKINLYFMSPTPPNPKEE